MLVSLSSTTYYLVWQPIHLKYSKECFVACNLLVLRQKAITKFYDKNPNILPF